MMCFVLAKTTFLLALGRWLIVLSSLNSILINFFLMYVRWEAQTQTVYTNSKPPEYIWTVDCFTHIFKAFTIQLQITWLPRKHCKYSPHRKRDGEKDIQTHSAASKISSTSISVVWAFQCFAWKVCLWFILHLQSNAMTFRYFYVANSHKHAAGAV